MRALLSIALAFGLLVLAPMGAAQAQSNEVQVLVQAYNDAQASGDQAAIDAAGQALVDQCTAEGFGDINLCVSPPAPTADIVDPQCTQAGYTTTADCDAYLQSLAGPGTATFVQDATDAYNAYVAGISQAQQGDYDGGAAAANAAAARLQQVCAANGYQTMIDCIQVDLPPFPARPQTQVADADGDGYAADTDCNDSDAQIYPGATEVMDGIDNNCDGTLDDAVAAQPTGPTQDQLNQAASDANAAVNDYQTALGQAAAGQDYDAAVASGDDAKNRLGGACLVLGYSDITSCLGGNPLPDMPARPQTKVADADGDSYPAGSDCDDANAQIYPGAPEAADGIDNNCDGTIDEAVAAQPTGPTQDQLNQAASDANTALNDYQTAASQAAAGQDYDAAVASSDDAKSRLAAACLVLGYNDTTTCLGGTPLPDMPARPQTQVADADGDGYPTASGDCNDADALIFPGATELADGIDNNCDGTVDEGLAAAQPTQDQLVTEIQTAFTAYTDAISQASTDYAGAKIAADAAEARITTACTALGAATILECIQQELPAFPPDPGQQTAAGTPAAVDPRVAASLGKLDGTYSAAQTGDPASGVFMNQAIVEIQDTCAELGLAIPECTGRTELPAMLPMDIAQQVTNYQGRAQYLADNGVGDQIVAELRAYYRTVVVACRSQNYADLPSCLTAQGLPSIEAPDTLIAAASAAGGTPAAGTPAALTDDEKNAIAARGGAAAQAYYDAIASLNNGADYAAAKATADTALADLQLACTTLGFPAMVDCIGRELPPFPQPATGAGTAGNPGAVTDPNLAALNGLVDAFNANSANPDPNVDVSAKRAEIVNLCRAMGLGDIKNCLAVNSLAIGDGEATVAMNEEALRNLVTAFNANAQSPDPSYDIAAKRTEIADLCQSFGWGDSLESCLSLAGMTLAAAGGSPAAGAGTTAALTPEQANQIRLEVETAHRAYIAGFAQIANGDEAGGSAAVNAAAAQLTAACDKLGYDVSDKNCVDLVNMSTTLVPQIKAAIDAYNAGLSDPAFDAAKAYSDIVDLCASAGGPPDADRCAAGIGMALATTQAVAGNTPAATVTPDEALAAYAALPKSDVSGDRSRLIATLDAYCQQQAYQTNAECTADLRNGITRNNAPAAGGTAPATAGATPDITEIGNAVNAYNDAFSQASTGGDYDTAYAAAGAALARIKAACDPFGAQAPGLCRIALPPFPAAPTQAGGTTPAALTPEERVALQGKASNAYADYTNSLSEAVSGDYNAARAKATTAKAALEAACAQLGAPAMIDCIAGELPAFPAAPAGGTTNVAATPAGQCDFANDGECDEVGIGTGACKAGTDTADCHPGAAVTTGGQSQCPNVADGKCGMPGTLSADERVALQGKASNAYADYLSAIKEASTDERAASAKAGKAKQDLVDACAALGVPEMIDCIEQPKLPPFMSAERRAQIEAKRDAAFQAYTKLVADAAVDTKAWATARNSRTETLSKLLDACAMLELNPVNQCIGQELPAFPPDPGGGIVAAQLQSLDAMYATYKSKLEDAQRGVISQEQWARIEADFTTACTQAGFPDIAACAQDVERRAYIEKLGKTDLVNQVATQLLPFVDAYNGVIEDFLINGEASGARARLPAARQNIASICEANGLGSVDNCISTLGWTRLRDIGPLATADGSAPIDRISGASKLLLPDIMSRWLSSARALFDGQQRIGKDSTDAVRAQTLTLCAEVGETDLTKCFGGKLAPEIALNQSVSAYMENPALLSAAAGAQLEADISASCAALGTPDILECLGSPLRGATRGPITSITAADAPAVLKYALPDYEANYAAPNGPGGLTKFRIAEALILNACKVLGFDTTKFLVPGGPVDACLQSVGLPARSAAGVNAERAVAEATLREAVDDYRQGLLKLVKGDTSGQAQVDGAEAQRQALCDAFGFPSSEACFAAFGIDPLPTQAEMTSAYSNATNGLRTALADLESDAKVGPGHTPTFAIWEFCAAIGFFPGESFLAKGSLDAGGPIDACLQSVGLPARSPQAVAKSRAVIEATLRAGVEGFRDALTQLAKGEPTTFDELNADVLNGYCTVLGYPSQDVCLTSLGIAPLPALPFITKVADATLTDLKNGRDAYEAANALLAAAAKAGFDAASDRVGQDKLATAINQITAACNTIAGSEVITVASPMSALDDCLNAQGLAALSPYWQSTIVPPDVAKNLKMMVDDYNSLAQSTKPFDKGGALKTIGDYCQANLLGDLKNCLQVAGLSLADQSVTPTTKETLPDGTTVANAAPLFDSAKGGGTTTTTTTPNGGTTTTTITTVTTTTTTAPKTDGEAQVNLPKVVLPVTSEPGKPINATTVTFTPPKGSGGNGGGGRNGGGGNGPADGLSFSFSATISPNGGVVFQLGGQMVISNPEKERGRVFDPKKDEISYEALTGHRLRETVTKPDGKRVVTVRGQDGEVERRSVIKQPGGPEIVLVAGVSGGRNNIGAGKWRDPGDDLPPLHLTMPARDYVLDSDDADEDDLEFFLFQPPVEQVKRLYTIEEVKRSARIRDSVRRLELGNLTFDSGKATISRDQVAGLEGLADAMLGLLERDPAETFLIEGHTDAVGDDLSNLELSDDRANEIASILSEEYDVPAENLVTQGYGENFLKVDTDEAERLNRRVTIRRITPLITVASED